jgi:hypothetical protein
MQRRNMKHSIFQKKKIVAVFKFAAKIVKRIIMSWREEEPAAG